MKQSLVNTSASLLREKRAASASVIPVPELSEDINGDIAHLEFYNKLLDTGVPRSIAHAEALAEAGNAAQELAQKGKGSLVVIDDFITGQNQAAAATKLSTGSMIAQSVASAALTGAISMGVTLAVNGLVMGLDYLAHAHERAVEAVDNANAAYADNQQELENTSQSLADVEERLNALNNIEHKSLAEEAETEELATQCMSIENSVCANPNEWRRRCFLWQGDRMQKNTKAPAGSRGRAGRMSGAKKGVE